MQLLTYNLRDITIAYFLAMRCRLLGAFRVSVICNVTGKIKFQDNELADGGAAMIFTDPKSIVPVHDFKSVHIVNIKNIKGIAKTMPTAKEMSAATKKEHERRRTAAMGGDPKWSQNPQKNLHTGCFPSTAMSNNDAISLLNVIGWSTAQ